MVISLEKMVISLEKIVIWLISKQQGIELKQQKSGCNQPKLWFRQKKWWSDGFNKELWFNLTKINDDVNNQIGEMNQQKLEFM